MQYKLGLLLAGGLLAAALTANAASRRVGLAVDTADRTDPIAATVASPTVAPPSGSLILSIRLDALGVEVFTATAKPSLRYRAIARVTELPFQWDMLDAAGNSLARGGFDPGPIDLDPARHGQAARVFGDQLLPTELSMNIKVPALDFARLEFSRRVGDRLERFGGPLRLADVEVR